MTPVVLFLAGVSASLAIAFLEKMFPPMHALAVGIVFWGAIAFTFLAFLWAIKTMAKKSSSKSDLRNIDYPPTVVKIDDPTIRNVSGDAVYVRAHDTTINRGTYENIAGTALERFRLNPGHTLQL